MKRVGQVFWENTRTSLGGLARAWWDEHQDDLVELGEDEAREIFDDLRAGRTLDAKLTLVASMSREEWRAYRDGTTTTMGALAARRARLFDALGELGVNAAKAIGSAALGALLP